MLRYKYTVYQSASWIGSIRGLNWIGLDRITVL